VVSFDRRKMEDQRRILVPVGTLSGLPTTDLRTLDRHRDAAVTNLIPAAVLPLVPAARAVRRAGATFTDQMRIEHTRVECLANKLRGAEPSTPLIVIQREQRR
jgi:hypothetical protein